MAAQPLGDFITPETNYNEHGMLLSTDPCGIHECPSGNPGCSSAQCQHNMQASEAALRLAGER